MVLVDVPSEGMDRGSGGGVAGDGLVITLLDEEGNSSCVETKGHVLGAIMTREVSTVFFVAAQIKK
jgi:hypothetical protein